MESQKYIEDLSEIKNLMNKSSRFMSLSGLSGILAGVYALIGFFFAYRSLSFLVLPGISIEELEAGVDPGYSGLLSAFTGGYVDRFTIELAIIGILTLIAAVTTGIILTLRKAKKQDEKLWNQASKRLIIHFIIPLIAGGVFCIVLLQNGIIGLVAPCTLIFYGLALINASKYTIGDIKSLGVAILLLGLISTQFIGYGLFFWALGFGIFHIIYGSLIYFKYDRN